MRWSAGILALLLACSAPPEVEPTPAPEPAAAAPLAPEVLVRTIVATPRLLVAVPIALVEREGIVGLRVRLTNRSDTPFLADLRSADRVIGVGPGAVHMPLTEAQRSELSMISALTQIPAHGSIEYAVPLPPLEPTCTDARVVTLSGVLVVMDDDRISELVADGVEIAIPCSVTPEPRAPGVVWVDQTAAMVAAPRALETFGEDFLPFVRAASVDPETDIALLSFSYDARPIERFRYDACVALDRCPPRSVAQPPGSLRTPAVGMSWEAAELFCATRGLHVASEAERSVIADPTRALLTGDAAALVLAGFVCVRPEPS